MLLAVVVSAPSRGHAESPGAAESPRATKATHETRWLARYLQFDSSNPPGNERPAIEWLATLLANASLETKIFVSPGGRSNLIARLRATESFRTEGTAPAIVLLHHVDVVPPGGEAGWRHPPFGGETAEGALWGRGAFDAKSLGIAQLAALLAAADEPVRRRELVFLATADEEAGGGEGVGWLLSAHPELFSNVEAVLNEGGAGKSVAGRPLWWGIEVDQKRPLWLEVIARGREGHGSSADPASAAHQLIAGLGRVVERDSPLRPSASAVRFLAALGRYDPRAARAAEQGDRLLAGESADRIDRKALAGFENLFRDGVQVTTLAGAERINVIPGTATAGIDVRLLPETDERLFLAELRETLGDDLELRILLSSPAAPPSHESSRSYRVIAARLASEAPVVPTFLPAFTDSRFFRARGIPAYGVNPFALDAVELLTVHAPNERISITAFERGVARMKAIVRDLVTSDTGESSEP